MDDREKWQEMSGISLLMARHHDDDDGIYIREYAWVCVKSGNMDRSKHKPWIQVDISSLLDFSKSLISLYVNVCRLK